MLVNLRQISKQFSSCVMNIKRWIIFSRNNKISLYKNQKLNAHFCVRIFGCQCLFPQIKVKFAALYNCIKNPYKSLQKKNILTKNSLGEF